MIIVGKFIAGVGAGGLYPLGGALSVEKTKDGGEQKLTASAWVISNQILGKTYPYLVALIFSGCSHQVSFRAIFFCGMIVNFLCGFCAPRTSELSLEAQGAVVQNRIRSEQIYEDVVDDSHSQIRSQEQAHAQINEQEESAFKKSLKDKKWLRALIGTGGTWFLFDVANYGVELHTPDLVAEIFGDANDIPSKVGQSLSILYFGVFGAAFSILWIRQRWSIKWLEIVGFVLSAFCCLLMAFAYQFEWSKWVKFGLLMLIQAALFIPNVTTYVLPLLTYPQEIRCSYHGLSAFLGKCGAAAGAYITPVLARSDWGLKKNLANKIFA